MIKRKCMYSKQLQCTSVWNLHWLPFYLFGTIRRGREREVFYLVVNKSERALRWTSTSISDKTIVFRTHSIGSGVCHRESTKPAVNDVKVLVFELVAVDTLSTSSIKVGKVSALYILSIKLRSVIHMDIVQRKQVYLSDFSIQINMMMSHPVIHSK